jgi:hypothetical protein
MTSALLALVTFWRGSYVFAYSWSLIAILATYPSHVARITDVCFSTPGLFLPGLASNLNPPDLCHLSS